MSLPHLSYTLAITNLVTPMRDNRIDFDGFEKLIQYQIESGIKDILLAGSTGEGLLLEEKEKEELLKRASAYKDLRIWLACIESSSSKAQKFIKKTLKYPVHGYFLLAPYYIKPTQDDILHYLLDLMETAERPCIIYNNPSRSAVSINETILPELIKAPHFFGITESDHSAGRMQRLSQKLGSHQWMLCGDDLLLPAALMAGARGVISTASNALAKLLLSLLKHFEENRLDLICTDIQQWLEVASALETLGNPRGIKALLSLMGKTEADMRAPLRGATSEQLKNLELLIKNHRELFPILT